MGVFVFDNEIFDSWLTKKSDEILSKVDREAISTEEMLILILKTQTNHFHHVDIEFRNEFKKIDSSFYKVYCDFQAEFKKIDDRFEKNRLEMQSEFKKNDDRFEKMNEKIDDRFEKMWSFQKWQAGILFGLFAGIYLKLFLG